MTANGQELETHTGNLPKNRAFWEDCTPWKFEAGFNFTRRH